MDFRYVRLPRRGRGEDFRMSERNSAISTEESAISTDGSTVAITRFPAMRMLLSPVNASVSAARHVLWYLNYHAGPRQSR